MNATIVKVINLWIWGREPTPDRIKSFGVTAMFRRENNQKGSPAEKTKLT